MKKIILLSAAALLIAGSLEARRINRHYYPPVHHQVYYGGHGGWVAPFVIGGMLGYTLSRPDVVYTSSPRVIYTNPPLHDYRSVYYQPNTAIQQSVEISTPAPLYEERWVYFDDCQCERKVLISTQR